MGRCRTDRSRVLCFLLTVTLLCLGLSSVRAQPAGPSEYDDDIAILVVNLLEQYHLKSQKVDDEVSVQFFESFLKEFDPAKMYFEKRDIEEFEYYKIRLDDAVARGDLSFAYQVHARFLKRAKERLPFVEELLDVPHEFTKDEYLSTDYDNLDYADTPEEIRRRWRKKIKYDLLLQRLADDPLPEAEQKQKVLRRYRSLVRRWEQIDSDEMLELYLTALSSCYDPHTSYMSPSTLEDFYISMSLQLEGIGARLRSEDGFTIVDAILAGGAADRHGKLKVGDKIVGVDADGDGEETIDVVDMKLPSVVKLIRGPRGTQVMLRVLPAGQDKPVDYKVTRDKIQLRESEARGEIVEHGKKPDGSPYRFGYIDLPSFYMDMAAADAGDPNFKSSTRDLKKLLRQFLETEGGIDGLILDLRSNGGGALKEAINAVGLFIDQGAVVQVKSSGRGVEPYHDRDGGEVFYSGPLMVLVSKLSASASEIFAGAIQDYGRGIVVGDSSTHGKGTVQTMVDLGRQIGVGRNRLGALKLTIQQFYRVNGHSTQNRGVPSDVVLPSLIGHMEIGERHLPHALPFDSEDPVTHPDLGWVSPEMIHELQKSSDLRRSKSEDFLKLKRSIARLEERQKRKAIPLNEAKLAEMRRGDEVEKSIRSTHDPIRTQAQENNGPDQPDKPVFERTFYHNEVLAIMEEYLHSLRKESLTAAKS